jgi:hypothetical protein
MMELPPTLARCGGSGNEGGNDSRNPEKKTEIPQRVRQTNSGLSGDEEGRGGRCRGMRGT